MGCTNNQTHFTFVAGTRGYGAVVDDERAEARVVRSTLGEVRTVATFPFVDGGKRAAISAACLTAYDLDQRAAEVEAA